MAERIRNFIFVVIVVTVVVAMVTNKVEAAGWQDADKDKTSRKGAEQNRAVKWGQTYRQAGETTAQGQGRWVNWNKSHTLTTRQRQPTNQRTNGRFEKGA